MCSLTIQLVDVIYANGIVNASEVINVIFNDLFYAVAGR